MFSRDGRHGVSLVEHHKIIGKKDAAGAAIVPGTGRDVGEQERMVDDDDVGDADSRAGTLIEARFVIAVFAGAGRRIGVDEFPNIGRWGRRELVAQAIGAAFGPRCDTLELGVLGRGNEFVLVAQGDSEVQR